MVVSQRKVKSNLFKLKESVTLQEAARHLSSIFNEDVTEADILTFVLKGHLKLSVNFIGTHAKPCLVRNADLIDIPVKTDEHCNLINIYKPENRICFLKGIYDLPMIGAEKSIVEHEWQQLKGNKVVGEYINLIETAVESQEGQIYLLQTLYFPEIPLPPSQPEVPIPPLQPEVPIPPSQPELPFTSLPIDLITPQYGPSNGLPSDSVLVIRTSALLEFEERLASEESGEEKLPNEKEEKTNLHIIGALVQVILEGKLFPNEEKLRNQISKEYRGLFGCSERTIAGRFAEAKKLINKFD